jgi:competence protein ComEC
MGGLCKIMGGFQSQIASSFQPIFRLMDWDMAAVRLTFEGGVVAFGVGIAVYFAWPHEPLFSLVFGMALGLFILSRLVSFAFVVPITVMAISVAGFGWAAFSSYLHSPNPIRVEQRFQVQGWVSDIQYGGRMTRLIVDVEAIEPVPDSGIPEMIRLRVGKNFSDVRLGDGLDLPTVLSPLPGPAIPNGYDPGRRAFFDGLAGTGFAISRGAPWTPDLSAIDRFQLAVTRSRHNIADRVRQRAPSKTEGLQAALLTGIRDYIPDEQTENLRASGLAHILAISGLHMGIVAFGVYAFVSLCLAAIETLARRRDVRKIAALIAIVAATLFLLISGGSVATQRAYIMVCIAFLAVILNRRAISIRSVAVAALITLLIRPEVLVSVGFQMSFAAVAAMVVIFRAWQDRWPARKADGFLDRVKAFYGSLFGTSLVAGFATGGFALLHFGRIAHYGLLANMLAMAVFPLIMTMGILALLVMPLGLEAWPLWMMSQLLTFMLWVADWVSAMPGAVGTVRASQPWVIALFGFGFAISCITKRLPVLFGLGLMILAVLLWSQATIYDVRVDRQGRVSLLSPQYGAVTSNLRADRYGRDQFARASGSPDQQWTGFRDVNIPCDALGCRVRIGNTIISLIEAPSEVGDACQTSDIVILAERRAGPVARRGCNVPLFDRRDLSRTGGIHIQSDDPSMWVPVISEQRRARPWG